MVKMNMKLTEGKWLHYDIWHQLRVARSIYKREDSPAPSSTKNDNTFNIKVSGPIEDSVFKNADFLMEMPLHTDSWKRRNKFNRWIVRLFSESNF